MLKKKVEKQMFKKKRNENEKKNKIVRKKNKYRK